MKYVVIAPVILNVLLWPAIRCERYREVQLINQLNNFFCFDHNIFLVDPMTDPHPYIPSQNSNCDGHFRTQTVFVLNSETNDAYFWYGPKPIVRKFRGKNTLVIVVAGSWNSENDERMLTLISRLNTIQQINLRSKIVMFFDDSDTSLDVVERLFRLNWKDGVADIVCAFYSMSSFNVYRYDPFNIFELINLTGSESFQKYFFDKVPNYYQHPLQVYVDSNYQANVFNSVMDFWRSVARVFNTTLSTTRNITAAEFKLSLYSRTSIPSRLYPLFNRRTVLLVPHAQPITDVAVYLQNSTWMRLFAYTFVMIVAAILVLAISGYLHTQKILHFQCAVHVIDLLMNNNDAIRYRQLHRADIFIILPFTFAGLIVMNGIVSVFQSFLTVPIYGRQINSIDDLYRSSLHIGSITGPKEHTNRLMESISGHGNWMDRVSEIRVFEDIISGDYSFANNSLAYIVWESQFKQLTRMQERFGLKALNKLTNLEHFFTSLYVVENFPFIDAVNDIIHYYASSGLLNKHHGTSKNDFYLDDENVRRLESISKSVSDGGFNVPTVPTVIWCGWISSVIVFIFELIWHKILPQVKKLKEKLSIRQSVRSRPTQIKPEAAV